MNYYSFASLLTAISGTISGSVVLFYNPKNKRNWSFALNCFSIALWTYFYTLWQLSKTAETALFFVRIQMMFCAFIPVTNYHHILTMFEAESRTRKKFLYTLYFLAIVIAASGFTPYFIPRVEPKLFFPFWPVPGFFIHLLFITLPIPILSSLYLIWERKNKSSPLVQNQLKWLFLSTAIGYGGGCTNCLLWYNIPVPPFLAITVAFFPPISAFLFFRLGLLDINFFFKKTIIYMVTAGLMGTFFTLIAYPFFGKPLAVIFIYLIVFISPILYIPLANWVRKFIGKTKLGGANLKEVDETMERIRETTYTYDDLAKNIVNSMLKTFPIEMAAVYFYDLAKKEYSLRAQRGMRNPLVGNLRFNRSALALSETDPLLTYLTGRRNVVNVDNLENDQERSMSNAAVIKSMERIEADICAPFLFAGKVKGIMVLSRKKDNTLFNAEDLEAIYAFARMGEEIMRYIMGMETELTHTALYSHDMNNDTRSLVQTLEFLQSPLAKSRPEEKIRGLINQAHDVAERLNYTFQLNRDRSSLIMKSIRGEYERMVVKADKPVRDSYGKFVILTEKQNVQFSAAISEQECFILANPDDLTRVIDNLISNALRYVGNPGFISLEAKEMGDNYQIIVHNNGKGIPPDEIDHIWEMGWQAKSANRGAAGFGLSIAKQVIQLHHGTITAQSDGDGTTFTILIPLHRSEPVSEK